MAHWVVWLSNNSPPFAAYRAVNSSRMLADDKKPRVCPLACREIWMRLWADCLNSETKIGATAVCGNVNLCAGLRASIEGNLHAVRAVWPQSAGWECNGGEVMAPQRPPKAHQWSLFRQRTLAKLLIPPACATCQTAALGPHSLMPGMASMKSTGT